MKHIQYPVYKFPVEGKWRIIKEKELDELKTKDKAQFKWWDDFIYQSQVCPIRNFLAHGVKSDTGNEGLDFLNDWNNDLLLMLGGNQQGKTSVGAAFTIFHGAIPLDPDWPCFKNHGVEYHEWTGPKKVIIASYSRDTVTELWRNYLNWLPREELGVYAPGYGLFPGEDGKPKRLTFGDSRAKTCTLKCGTEITVLCYSQAQGQWEGRQCDIAHADEQPPEDKMDGLIARQLTRGDYCPIVMTLTGHILEGRPDTGAGGWIKRKMIDEGKTKGRKFKLYHLSMASTPDALISKEKKDASYRQWVVEPEQNNDMKKINEGLARYGGGWEVGGGLIFSEWAPDIHLIEPFNIYAYSPTLYRMIDHGQDPCAALLFAKMPWGDVVVFKEYYEYGFSIAENSKKIVEDFCGNRRVKVDEYVVEGQTWPVYQEEQSRMVFAGCELDGKSFGTKTMESKKTIGSLYNQFGLSCKPASGQKDAILIPLVKQYLALDKSGTHINVRLDRPWVGGLAKFGAPKMYFFNTLRNCRTEIEGYVSQFGTMKVSNKTADHLVSAIRFFSARERPYLGAQYAPIIEEESSEKEHRQAWRI